MILFLLLPAAITIVGGYMTYSKESTKTAAVNGGFIVVILGALFSAGTTYFSNKAKEKSDIRADSLNIALQKKIATINSMTNIELDSTKSIIKLGNHLLGNLDNSIKIEDSTQGKANKILGKSVQILHNQKKQLDEGDTIVAKQIQALKEITGDTTKPRFTCKAFMNPDSSCNIVIAVNDIDKYPLYGVHVKFTEYYSGHLPSTSKEIKDTIIDMAVGSYNPIYKTIIKDFRNGDQVMYRVEYYWQRGDQFANILVLGGIHNKAGHIKCIVGTNKNSAELFRETYLQQEKLQHRE